MKKIIFLLALTATQALAANNTPDFYKCTNKVGGEWNFGRAPNGCDGSTFGADSVVKEDYGSVVFLDDSTRDPERKRYMEELHAVIRDASSYYFKKRKPSASADEVEAFQMLVLTTAAQESYWSHYRLASDKRYKMMRGDFGHGHGMMQVDDRAHFDAIGKGLGWNMMGNMAYGMDILFTNWEAAPKKTCVSSPTNWEARTRSAWAAYNGGSGKICRWTNPKDAWAKNDEGFYSNYKNKRWKAYVTNMNKPSSVNVECLIEKRENCPVPGEPVKPRFVENMLYRTPAGAPCVFKSGALQCMDEYRDFVCLRAVSSFTNATAEVMADDALQGVTVKKLDRHATCKAFDPTLLGVGSMLETTMGINLRATPGGVLLSTTPQGEVAEVLDFELRGVDVKDRYYKVSVDDKTGYLYAGTPSTQADWVVASSRTSPLPTVVARVGEQVQVVNAVGINLRDKPDGALLTHIPTGTKLAVEGYVIQNTQNYVYYKVTFNKKNGYIYSGALLPKDSTGTWTKRIK